MIAVLTPTRRFQTVLSASLRRICPSLTLFTLLILFPALALAQSPFDTGFTAMQTLFTGTVAKVRFFGWVPIASSTSRRSGSKT
ncbi:hypothetical protein [Terracidiphilus sp.]|uniref:hypothetical protein n=1 Tax=Terracidiphilus sp. TaxID=1964191 RepID=UPI003C24F769